MELYVGLQRDKFSEGGIIDEIQLTGVTQSMDLTFYLSNSQ